MWFILLPIHSVFANSSIKDLIDSKDPNGIEAISNGIRIDRNTYHLDRLGYDTNVTINIKTNEVVLQKDGNKIHLVPEQIENPSVEWTSLRANKELFDIVTQNIDGGIRQAILIYDKDAPKTYDFNIDLPSGFSLEKDEIGWVKILDEKWDLFVVILLPWAKDYNDMEIKTWYEIDGNILRQFVEFDENNVFPIVADPSWCADTLTHVYWTLNRGWKHPDSLSTERTDCGKTLYRTGLSGYIDEGWDEFMRKVPLFGWPWSPQSGTYEYWSLNAQFKCHAHFALAKQVWNIEHSRPQVSWWEMTKSLCNPE